MVTTRPHEHFSPLAVTVTRTWLLIVLSTAFFAEGTMAQLQISLNTNGIRGVELLGSEHIPQELASAITAHNAAAILPYTVVVRNTGSLPVTGLDVRYEIVTKGDLRVHNFFYGSPVDLADAASIPIIAPGGTVVVGPSHMINEQLNWGTLSLSARHDAKMAATLDFFSKADRITISIDSVIRSDGVLLGPDRSETFEKFQEQINGYRGFRDQLLKLFEKGESDATIISWLQQTADARVMTVGKNRRADQSTVVKKTEARYYLAYMTQGQRQRALDALRRAIPERYSRRIAKVRKEVEP